MRTVHWQRCKSKMWRSPAWLTQFKPCEGFFGCGTVCCKPVASKRRGKKWILTNGRDSKRKLWAFLIFVQSWFTCDKWVTWICTLLGWKSKKMKPPGGYSGGPKQQRPWFHMFSWQMNWNTQDPCIRGLGERLISGVRQAPDTVSVTLRLVSTASKIQSLKLSKVVSKKKLPCEVRSSAGPDWRELKVVESTCLFIAE